MTTEEKQIEAYLSGEMTPEQVISFEKKLQQNPDLKRDIEVYQEMERIYDNDWAQMEPRTTNKKVSDHEDFLKSEKGQVIITNLRETEQSFFKKKTSFPFRKVTLFAASVAAVFCILFFTVYDQKDDLSSIALYEKHSDWTDLPSFTTKGSEDQSISEAEANFNQGNYTEALSAFKNLNTNDTNSKDLLSIYIGLSLLETNKTEQAITTLQELADHWKYGSRVRWYLALAFLRMDDLEKSKSLLHSITNDSSNYNYQKALDLLGEID